MLALLSSPLALRLTPPMMQIQEACTLNGGKPTGTLDQVRLMGGVVVPTSAQATVPAVTVTNAGIAPREEACAMNGGRPSGTLDQVRLMGGVIVPATGDAPSLVVSTNSGMAPREEACAMNGGRPSGTLDQVRLMGGVVVPSSGDIPTPAVGVSKVIGRRDEACTMGGGRVSGTPVAYRGGSAAVGSGADILLSKSGVVVPSKIAAAETSETDLEAVMQEAAEAEAKLEELQAKAA